MVLYCHAKHGSQGDQLCDACDELHEYAMLRIRKCPYKENKPACASCPIHCYQRIRREEMKTVMRYSGPRMLRRHPVMAIFHILDGLRNVEDLRHKRKTDT